MPLKSIAKELGILISVAIIAAFTINFVSPKGITLVGDWHTSQGTASANSNIDGGVLGFEIDDVMTAKTIYDGGNTVFVDARPQGDYEDSHIQGAVSLPIDQFDILIDSFIADYPFSAALVTYGAGRGFSSGHELAQYLSDIGYTDVRVLLDGYHGWEAEGYPVESYSGNFFLQ
jgi:rhodanese-related sulfurtransferase